MPWARMEVRHASAVPGECGRNSRARATAARTPDLPSLLRHWAGVAVMTAALATRSKAHVFVGSPDQVRQVRDFVGRVVAGCPVAGDVVLLASEVATNAIEHTASGAGGSFTVAVCRSACRVRVEILDDGSVKTPVAHRPGRPGERGCGLFLVSEFAARWGYSGGQHGRVVWFEVEW
jgi:serine/threonine-protein kinase RsbW